VPYCITSHNKPANTSAPWKKHHLLPMAATNIIVTNLGRLFLNHLQFLVLGRFYCPFLRLSFFISFSSFSSLSSFSSFPRISYITRKAISLRQKMVGCVSSFFLFFSVFCKSVHQFFLLGGCLINFVIYRVLSVTHFVG
jgi:hypothetical protein